MRPRRLGRVVLLASGGLILALVMVRSSVASLHRANGPSDAPTIRSGEAFLVNRLAYDLRLPLDGRRLVRLSDPRRGDLVLFSLPGSGHLATKRVVAIPGDVVEVRAGRLVLNGVAAQYRTPAAGGPSNTLIKEWGGTSHFVICPLEESATDAGTVAAVPPGHYFLMGDNRGQSSDSRDFGPISREDIHGRVVLPDRTADRR